jgi:1-acyl-sn-glycerol-3-phosphate acyltransferase
MLKEIGFRLIAKFDHVDGLEHFPEAGPAILMINHIAFIDPIVVLGCLPRNIVPLAKEEVYKIPIWGIFPRLWEVIPVRRGEVDRRALTLALQVLSAGEVILVAPEGTRNDSLRRGKEGIAYLGYRSGAPIIPVAVEGTMNYPTLTPASRKAPGATVQLGKPFTYRPLQIKPGREMLRKMTDEALYQLAAMLPEERRGYYADLRQATADTLDFA